MADRAPNTRASYPAPAPTPRPPSPPTSTGRPCSVGRVSCSTDAKNASMSRCSTQRESTIPDAIGLAGGQALAARVQPARRLLEKRVADCTLAASYPETAREERLARHTD